MCISFGKLVLPRGNCQLCTLKNEIKKINTFRRTSENTHYPAVEKYKCLNKYCNLGGGKKTTNNTYGPAWLNGLINSSTIHWIQIIFFFLCLARFSSLPEFKGNITKLSCFDTPSILRPVLDCRRFVSQIQWRSTSPPPSPGSRGRGIWEGAWSDPCSIEAATLQAALGEV